MAVCKICNELLAILESKTDGDGEEFYEALFNIAKHRKQKHDGFRGVALA